MAVLRRERSVCVIIATLYFMGLFVKQVAWSWSMTLDTSLRRFNACSLLSRFELYIVSETGMLLSPDLLRM